MGKAESPGISRRQPSEKDPFPVVSTWMDCVYPVTYWRTCEWSIFLRMKAKPSSGPYLIRHIVSSEETGCGLSFWSQLRAYPLPTTDQPGHYEKSHHVSSHIRPRSSDRLLPLSERFKVKMQELAWARPTPVIGVVLCQNDYKMRGAFLSLTPN